MTIERSLPPVVGQTLDDSCWAAVLESWSRIDDRFGQHLSQSRLISTYGEGPTGGITPASKIPLIAMNYNLVWEMSAFRRLPSYFARYLPTSHIFCAYQTQRQFMHSVLIYRVSDINFARFMEPAEPARYWGQSLDWFSERGPFVLMHKR